MQGGGMGQQQSPVSTTPCPGCDARSILILFPLKPVMTSSGNSTAAHGRDGSNTHKCPCMVVGTGVVSDGRDCCLDDVKLARTCPLASSNCASVSKPAFFASRSSLNFGVRISVDMFSSARGLPPC